MSALLKEFSLQKRTSGVGFQTNERDSHRVCVGPGSRQVARAVWESGPETPMLGLAPLILSVGILG